MAVGTDASATLTAFPNCYTRARPEPLGLGRAVPDAPTSMRIALDDVRFLGETGHSTADFAVRYNTAVTSAATDKYCTLPQNVATRHHNAATISADCWHSPGLPRRSKYRCLERRRR